MNIKYFAVLFFVAFADAKPYPPVKLDDPIGPIREKCRLQSHMTVDALANGVHTPEQIGPYLLCFGHATGVLTQDGEINKKAIVKVSEDNLSKNILIEMTDICVEKVNLSAIEDPLMKMLILSNCVKDVLGGELLRLTGYCQPPTWPRLQQYAKIKAEIEGHKD